MASVFWSVMGSLSGVSRHVCCVSRGKVLSHNNEYSRYCAERYVGFFGVRNISPLGRLTNPTDVILCDDPNERDC